MDLVIAKQEELPLQQIYLYIKSRVKGQRLRGGNENENKTFSLSLMRAR